MTIEQTTFSWRNYSKPTPKNLLRISEFIQGTLLGLSTVSLIMKEPTVAIWMNVAIIVVNRLVMFFGSIVEDAKTETAVAEFPSGEEVVVTKSIPATDDEPK